MKTSMILYAFLLLFVPTFIVAAEPSKPNIVFILADDMGVMDVKAFNPNTFYETPNIDRLATEGMRFTAGYAACNVCSPTRYSIMSGRYPARSGITNHLVGLRNERFMPADIENPFMALEEVTLGEAFREAGYRTACTICRRTAAVRWLFLTHVISVRLAQYRHC